MSEDVHAKAIVIFKYKHTYSNIHERRSAELVEADMRKADVLMNTDNYDGAVFYFQQAVEKALKAVHLLKLKEIPKGHSIIYLALQVKAPQNLLSGIRDLNPEYLVTRYPDMAAGVPAELYDEDIAKKHEKTAKGALAWAEKQIK